MTRSSPTAAIHRRTRCLPLRTSNASRLRNFVAVVRMGGPAFIGAAREVAVRQGVYVPRLRGNTATTQRRTANLSNAAKASLQSSPDWVDINGYEERGGRHGRTRSAMFGNNSFG